MDSIVHKVDGCRGCAILYRSSLPSSPSKILCAVHNIWQDSNGIFTTCLSHCDTADSTASGNGFLRSGSYSIAKMFIVRSYFLVSLYCRRLPQEQIPCKKHLQVLTDRHSPHDDKNVLLVLALHSSLSPL